MLKESLNNVDPNRNNIKIRVHFYRLSVARQMKTIQYSLASAKCMAEGWTVKPKIPIEQSSNCDEEIFHVEVNSTLLQVRMYLIVIEKEKHYS